MSWVLKLAITLSLGSFRLAPRKRNKMETLGRRTKEELVNQCGGTLQRRAGR